MASQKNNTVLILGLVFVVALLGLLFWQNQRPAETPTPPTEPDETPDESLTWETYEDETLNFSLEHPEGIVISEEAENRIEFMWLGSDQPEGTELTDGVRLLVSRLEYDNSTMSVEDFAEAQVAEAEGQGFEIVQGVSLDEDYEQATYHYKIDSLGSHEHLLVPVYPGVAFELSYYSSDDYDEMLERMLESFEVTDPERSVMEIEGEIEVDSPQLMQTVSSPLSLEGMVKGNWYFEGVFTVVLTDWDGRIIGQTLITEENWMTAEMIPFSGELSFTYDAETTPYSRGFLIFQKSNASGLPEHDMSLEIPVYLSE